MRPRLMKSRSETSLSWRVAEVVAITGLSLTLACGGSSYSGGGGSQGTAPPAPTGLTATPGNLQVSLSWTASSGATGYYVSRSTVTGGPYARIATLAGTTYLDSTVSNGSTYYYVVSAYDSAGASAN